MSTRSTHPHQAVRDSQSAGYTGGVTADAAAAPAVVYPDTPVGVPAGETTPLRAAGETVSTGSSSAPARNVGQCRLEFTAVAGDSAHIAFALTSGDETMLDLTDPTYPKPVEAGIYAYLLIVNQDGGGSGGPFVARLIVDDDWYSIPTGQTDSGTSLSGSGALAIGVTWYSDALSPLYALIADGSADTYSGYLFLQRVA